MHGERNTLLCAIVFSGICHKLSIIGCGCTHFLTTVVTGYLNKITNVCTEMNGYKTVHELSEAYRGTQLKT